MFVSDRIVFLELHKTGCTHIRNLLEELVGGQFIDKHNQANPNLFSGDRLFLGSIRDPWDWYISLWAYGCDHEGTVFRNLTNTFTGRGWMTNPYSAFRDLLINGPNRNAKKWKRTYKDVSDAGAFREWLHMMHDKDSLPNVDDGYRESPLGRVAGLLTHRYIMLFTCREGESDGLNSISTFNHLAEHERKHCFIDSFIRNENLESDLLAALKQAELKIPVETESKLMSHPKTNTSSRKNGPGYYYDTRTEALIADRDRIIVEKFGYRAPSSRD